MDQDDRRRALVEAGIALTSELSLEAVLEKLVQTAADLTGARYAALGIVDRSGQRLARFLTHGLTQEEYDAIGDLPTGRGILGVLIHDPRPLRLHDLGDDPRSVGFPPNHPPMRTFLGVPVLLRGVSYGRLYLTEKVGGVDFTEEDEEVVLLLAAQAAVAMDLSQRVERDALKRAVAAQEAERRRLARELHDETGQALTSILLGLAVVEQAHRSDDVQAALEDLRALVVDTLQDVRRLAVELRPKALDDFGLEPALRRLGQSVGEAGELDVQVEARLGDRRLPADVETAVYRIVQEAITNVIKHADARRVSVVLTRKNGFVSVVIEDDGSGFDPARPVEGIGLIGMRERVELLDGHLEVDSSPGRGTVLVVELPTE
jgi:two-component system, NarL family, sensor histidine kinase DevS